MRSKISCCNGTVLRRNLIRFCPLWFSFLAVWIVILPLSIISGGEQAYRHAGDLGQHILTVASTGGCLITFSYAIMNVMAYSNYLYSTRSVNTICTLPIRRETMFLTGLITSLLVWLVPSLLVALLTWLSGAAIGLPAGALALRWLAITGLQYVFFLGFSNFCAALVGQILALPALYLLLNFTGIVVNIFARGILSSLVYGMPQNSSDYVLGRFSPVYNLLVHTGVTGTEISKDVTVYHFARWGYLGVLAACGAALLVVSLFLLRRRRMESAGDIISVRCLRPVFKYCFTAGCSLVLGMLAASVLVGSQAAPHTIVILLCLLAGAFIGYFGAEMLLKKTIRVFRREWIGFGIFAAVLLCCIGALQFDLFGYERYVPDAQEVASVQFSGYSYDSAPITDEAHIADILALHQGAVSLKHEQLTLQQDTGGKTSSAPFLFIYHLKSGRTVSRSYTISVTETQWRDPKSLARQFSAVYNDPALILLRTTPAYPISAQQILWPNVSSYDVTDTYSGMTPTSEEAYELYTQAILPDLRDGLGGQSSLFFDGSSDHAYTACVSMQFSRPGEKDDSSNNDFYLNYTPVSGSRTEQWLLSHGVKLTLQSEYDAASAAKSNGKK